MSSKKNIIIIVICSNFLIAIVSFLLFYNNNVGLHKINYEKLNEMIENKETFALCISRTTCSHCEDYKPKLESFAKENNLNIYYIDIDTESKDNQEKFNDLISFNGQTPVTVFIKNGNEETTANRISGDVSESKIAEKFRINGFIK